MKASTKALSCGFISEAHFHIPWLLFAKLALLFGVPALEGTARRRGSFATRLRCAVAGRSRVRRLSVLGLILKGVDGNAIEAALEAGDVLPNKQASGIECCHAAQSV
jgi:hypothetical protein